MRKITMVKVLQPPFDDRVPDARLSPDRRPSILLGCVQYSSGCPFTCEFCDIPALYGRNPSLKSPQQILGELDELAHGGTPSIYFVDDNFIGNPRAALELLPHLVEWQRRRDYTVRLSCELTLNVAEYPEILKLMREAFMTNVFCGIETVDPDAPRAMSKRQNLRTPILQSVDTINSYGIEVKLAWLRGLNTTYYLRTLAATAAEKSTGEGGELNAVPTTSGMLATGASSRNAPATKATDTEPKFCKIDDPGCEACQ